MKLGLAAEAFAYPAPFRITGYEFTAAEVLTVRLSDGGASGWGEAAGVYYHGETPADMAAKIEVVRGEIEAGASRESLLRLLPAGGARNALDAALWDLEAKRAGRPAWALAGLARPRAVATTLTIGAGAPDAMAAEAGARASWPALKLKLTAEAPAACVAAVRAARPDAALFVDANQGFTRDLLEAVLPALAEAGVKLIEQPLPAGAEAELDGLSSAIPLAADESAQTSADLARLANRYQAVNIKLDKCGGLTEGFAMARAARAIGLKVMVGCMSGTSLSMAPAFLLAQGADIVDLDAPLFLASDRTPPAAYERGALTVPEALWGGGSGV